MKLKRVRIVTIYFTHTSRILKIEGVVEVRQNGNLIEISTSDVSYVINTDNMDAYEVKVGEQVDDKTE